MFFPVDSPSDSFPSDAPSASGRLPRAVAEVRNALRRCLLSSEVDDIYSANSRGHQSLLLVALSGGADSLALAAAAAQVVPRLGGRLGGRVGAIIVDHGLQAGSAQVAAQAAASAENLGLKPVLTVRVSSGRSGGPEAAAREARYRALGEAAARFQAAGVLLGHTRDDQAETVLLGLARGSGARSISGMRPLSGFPGQPDGKAALLRPLLGISRQQTREACQSLGLIPWEDPQNSDPTFTRSRLRSTVLPLLEAELGPGIAAALARSAAILQEDHDCLDELAAAALARWRCRKSGRKSGDLLLSVGLATEPAAIRRRVLRAAAALLGSSPSRVQTLALDALLVSWQGQGPAALPGRVSVSRAAGELRFLKTE